MTILTELVPDKIREAQNEIDRAGPGNIISRYAS